MSVTSWFRGISRTQRKGVLSLLHFFRRRLSENIGAQQDFAKVVPDYLDLMEHLEGIHHSAPDLAEVGEPKTLPLFCPYCGMSHVETGEFDRTPHHWHRCALCGREWRLHEYVYGVPPSDSPRPVMIARLLQEVLTELRAVNKKLQPGGDRRLALVRRIEGILFRGNAVAVVTSVADSKKEKDE